MYLAKPRCDCANQGHSVADPIDNREETTASVSVLPRCAAVDILRTAREFRRREFEVVRWWDE